MAFSNLPDREDAVLLLQRSLERGRLSHAYLFSGHQLDDLEIRARTLAKAVNCASPVRQGPLDLPIDSCDACSSCRRIDRNNHPDVQWIRPESKSRVITIDQMRELMQTINLKPSEAIYKVAVLVGADRLNIHAANAFLKTLEEPPPHSLMVLLTTEPQRVLETLVSRCLRLNFGGEDSRRFDSNQVSWLVAFADAITGENKGLMTRYRLLGGLIAHLTETKENLSAALTERSPLQRFDDAEPDLKEKWEDELNAAIEAEYRKKRNDLLTVLQYWLRDIWLATLSVDQELLHFPDLALQTHAIGDRLSPAQSARNLETVTEMQRLLNNTNVQEALSLEVGLLRLQL